MLPDVDSGAIMGVKEIQRRLRRLADKDKAIILKDFFMTGSGQHGEGGRFVLIERSKIQVRNSSSAPAVPDTFISAS